MTTIFTFSIPKDRNDKNFEKIIMNSNVNVCKMMNGVVGDFVSKMIMDDLKRALDYDIQCPMKKVKARNFYKKKSLKVF
jgi:hypothetical protein